MSNMPYYQGNVQYINEAGGWQYSDDEYVKKNILT